MAAEFEQFEKANPLFHGPKCSICKLPPELLVLVDGLLTAGKAKSLIAKYLKSKGHNVAGCTVSRHGQNHLG